MSRHVEFRFETLPASSYPSQIPSPETDANVNIEKITYKTFVCVAWALR